MLILPATRWMLRIWSAMVVASIAIESQASITINGLGSIQAVASNGLVGDTQTYTTPTPGIPSQILVNAVAGAAFANNTMDWSTSGGQTILSIDSLHHQSGFSVTGGSSVANGQVTSLQFIANVTAPFELTGFYNVVDTEFTGPRITHSIQFVEEGVGTLFNQFQISVSENSQFTVGTPGGNSVNILQGSPNGTLVAGRTYTLNYFIDNRVFAVGSASTTAGNLTLTIGERNGVVPEPATFVVWTLLGIAATAGYRLRRS